MTNTDMKKLYVAADGTVTFICPKCGSMVKEPAQKYKDHKGSLKVECSCSHSYEVQLEFRKFYRKETNIAGLYMRSSHAGDWGKMVVKNLSMGGCGFETWKKSTLVQGEEIKLEFKLDNTRGSIIKKKAVVCEVDGQYVGCKFAEPPGAYDPDLGFYLKIN
ncbi:MAG: PilZ domain-containing protein [Syntrophaceae bacterium]